MFGSKRVWSGSKRPRPVTSRRRASAGISAQVARPRVSASVCTVASIGRLRRIHRNAAWSPGPMRTVHAKPPGFRSTLRMSRVLYQSSATRRQREQDEDRPRRPHRQPGRAAPRLPGVHRERHPHGAHQIEHVEGAERHVGVRVVLQLHEHQDQQADRREHGERDEGPGRLLPQPPEPDHGHQGCGAERHQREPHRLVEAAACSSGTPPRWPSAGSCRGPPAGRSRRRPARRRYRAPATQRTRSRPPFPRSAP